MTGSDIGDLLVLLASCFVSAAVAFVFGMRYCARVMRHEIEDRDRLICVWAARTLEQSRNNGYHRGPLS